MYSVKKGDDSFNHYIQALEKFLPLIPENLEHMGTEKKISRAILRKLQNQLMIFRNKARHILDFMKMRCPRPVFLPEKFLE